MVVDCEQWLEDGDIDARWQQHCLLKDVVICCRKTVGGRHDQEGMPERKEKGFREREREEGIY